MIGEHCRSRTGELGIPVHFERRLEKGDPRNASSAFRSGGVWSLTKYWRRLCLAVIVIMPSVCLGEGTKEVDARLKQITQRIKRNILDDYRHGDANRYWGMFHETATFVDGRSEHPDQHDLTRTRGQENQRRAILARAEKDPQRDVFFRVIEPVYEASQLHVKMELVYHFFGGNRLEGHIYRIQTSDTGWQIIHTRRWVLHEAMGPDIRTFDTLYFKTADKDAEKALKNADLNLHERLRSLIRAKWMRTAFRVAKHATETTPRDYDAWRALGALAYEVSEFEVSKKAINTALKLKPDLVVPRLLKP